MAKKPTDAGGYSLVIVESPAKARTISKFLGKKYTIEASIGHIRDLPQGAKEIPEQYKKEDWAYLGVNVGKEDCPDAVYKLVEARLELFRTMDDKVGFGPDAAVKEVPATDKRAALDAPPMMWRKP